MTSAWRGFADELARWRDAGRDVDFWWRDDDATAPTAPLQRLIDLSQATGVPLALAVIPSDARPDLLPDEAPTVTVLQHGVAHRNGAPAGSKKSEFPADESVGAALDRLVWGRERLARLFGARSMSVLVPPWNRVSQAALVAALGGAGYCGLSRFGARSTGVGTSGLVQVNTHVDVIDWKGSRGFVGEEDALDQAVRHLLARRTGSADAAEPTGWLTHHAVHDEATWAFMHRLLEVTAGNGRVVWRSACALFAPGRP